MYFVISSCTDIADYIAFQFASLTFNASSVFGDEQCHRVLIIDDNVLESSETFFVTLTSPEPAFLGSNLTHTTVTIHPDPADCKLDM